MLVTGVFFGNATAARLYYQKMSGKNDNRHLFLILLLASLFWASMPALNSHIQTFSYQSQPRWSGPWNSPNIYGLLMAMGAILAIGSGVACLECQMLCISMVRSWKIGVKRGGVILFCVAAASFMGCGLLHKISVAFQPEVSNNDFWCGHASLDVGEGSGMLARMSCFTKAGCI